MIALMEEIQPDVDKPHAGFARLTENYWLVNVVVDCGVTAGEGTSPREALASIGFGTPEVEYLMQPGNHTIEDLREV
jgi:hypothetical protein